MPNAFEKAAMRGYRNESRTTIGPEGWMDKALADPAFTEEHTVRTETRCGRFTLDPDESLIERRRLAFWREKHAPLVAATCGVIVPELGEEETEDVGR